jgi:hypothetical protein
LAEPPLLLLLFSSSLGERKISELGSPEKKKKKKKKEPLKTKAKHTKPIITMFSNFPKRPKSKKQTNLHHERERERERESTPTRGNTGSGR